MGSTVDVPNASWTNTIGTPELIAVWTDPDFDPAQRAFYYGRVIEIPTPRWTAYDAKKFGIKLPVEVPVVTQERLGVAFFRKRSMIPNSSRWYGVRPMTVYYPWSGPDATPG